MSDTKPATAGELSDAELREMYPRLRRFAAAVAPQEIDPDDLMQEAIVRLLAHGTGDVIHVEAYVRQIIVHSASNHRRRLGRLRLAVGRLSRFPKVCAAVSAMQLSVWPNRPGKHHHHHLNQPQPTLVKLSTMDVDRVPKGAPGAGQFRRRSAPPGDVNLSSE